MTGGQIKKVHRALFEAVRSLYREGRTGVVRVKQGTHVERFYFIAGEIYLTADSELGAWAQAILRSRLQVAETKDREEEEKSWVDDFNSLVGEVRPEGKFQHFLALLAGIGVDEFGFDEGVSDIPTAAVGPMPTAKLLMESAVWDRDEFHLLRRLGGEEQKLVAAQELTVQRRLPDLDPQEAFLISRAERPTSVAYLIQQSSLDRESALLKICRLEAIGLLSSESVTPQTQEHRLVSAEVLKRFLERIIDDLEDRPLDLEAQDHLQQVSELFSRIGGLSHYEYLDVSVGASSEDVYQAYTELARLVHPAHVDKLGLQGKESILQVLFERATEAYLTLSDPVRRAEYQQLLGDQGPVAGPVVSAEQRVEERQELARENYQAAVARHEIQDYYGAIQLLQQAVLSDPQPDYYALLGECESHNANWLASAVQNFTKAVEMRPDSPELRVQFAEALERGGRAERAVEQLNAALELVPGHSGAAQHLHRLQVSVKAPADVSLLDRVKGIFK